MLEKTLICVADIFESIKFDNNDVTNDANIPRNKIEMTKFKFVQGVNIVCKLLLEICVISEARLKKMKPTPNIKKVISRGLNVRMNERVSTAYPAEDKQEIKSNKIPDQLVKERLLPFIMKIYITPKTDMIIETF